MVLLLAVRWSAAAPARFWLSTSSVLGPTSLPEAPMVSASDGSDVLMYIWFQPDAGKMVRNFSLNLVTTDPSVVSFPSGPGSNVVYNGPVNVTGYQTTNRFQVVYDADHGMSVNDPDGVRGMQGFSISTSGNPYTGIGGASCAGGDLYCSMTNSGPAWLVGSVKTHVDVSSGTANYFLQIGANGMNYFGAAETTSQMSVVFGMDSVNLIQPWTYNAQYAEE